VGVSPALEVEEEAAASPPLILDSLPGSSLLAIDKKHTNKNPPKPNKFKGYGIITKFIWRGG
jgi:hypothetical protein